MAKKTKKAIAHAIIFIVAFTTTFFGLVGLFKTVQIGSRFFATF